MPYPSAATGPNPNSLNAGFPQLEVLNIDVLSNSQPGSVKIAGSDLRFLLVLDPDTFEPIQGG